MNLSSIVGDTKKKRNLKQYGHLIRMNNERKPKQLYEAQPEERRPLGRLRRK